MSNKDAQKRVEMIGRELGVLLLDLRIYADADIMDGWMGRKLLESFGGDTPTFMSHTRKKRGENHADKINTKTRMNNFKNPVKLH